MWVYVVNGDGFFWTEWLVSNRVEIMAIKKGLKT